jgi:hypothetical protein
VLFRVFNKDLTKIPRNNSLLAKEVLYILNDQVYKIRVIMIVLEKIIKKIGQGRFFSTLFIKFINILIDKKILDLKLKTLIFLNLTTRPHYLYCLYYSAILAKKLGIYKISVIEFGVAGGSGILFLQNYQKKIFNETGVEIEIYGFDLGDGLTKPKDYRDLPYWFKESLYVMDKEKLNSKIKKAKLIIGDVKSTIKDFFKENNPSPIGAIFNDLDYYSSTKDSFEIFKDNENYYLPRIFCYFDDVIGNEEEMYGEFTGELLAIKEFNNENKNKKIILNRNLISGNFMYRYKIYHYHNFEHKDYNKFLFEDEQSKLLEGLKI